MSRSPRVDAAPRSTCSELSALAVVRPIRVRPALEVEPAILSEADLDRLYDEAQRQSIAPTTRYIQSCLAVDFRNADEDPHFGPQATVRTALPEPGEWARTMVAGMLESFSGMRAPAQFAHFMTSELYEILCRRHRVASRRGGRPAHRSLVRKVRVCEPADGVAEVSLVVHHEARVRAIAVRISGVDGRWLMTAFEMA